MHPLDFRGLTVYANFPLNTPLPKQTCIPFTNCVHVCVYRRGSYANGLLVPCCQCSKCHRLWVWCVCDVCKYGPGRGRMLFLGPTSLMSTHLHFRRGSGGRKYLIVVPVTGVYQSFCFDIFPFVLSCL